jgi:polyisoprenoid-binding protein YceI
MTTATATVPANKTLWKIDSAHTEAAFAVKHLMISTARGRFGAVEGTVEFDPASFANASAQVTIDAASIDTREAQRDAHLRSADFFDVEKYPVLTFKSRRVDEVKGDHFTLIGDLTIKDITREVALAVTAHGFQKDPWGGERTGFSAETSISRKEFGLLWNQILETGGLAVGDVVKISLDVELVKS